jgi:hypothetical protein
MPNVYYDQTARTLDVYAQVVYDQLFRLSWGHGREWCQIGYPKLAERAGISQNGARKGTRELVARGLIAQIEVDLASSNQADRGIRWRVMPPDGATAPSSPYPSSRGYPSSSRCASRTHERS